LTELTLVPLSSAELAIVSRLLDEAMAMGEDARESWLENLTEDFPGSGHPDHRIHDQHVHRTGPERGARPERDGARNSRQGGKRHKRRPEAEQIRSTRKAVDALGDLEQELRAALAAESAGNQVLAQR
jgi:hypothetical protein